MHPTSQINRLTCAMWTTKEWSKSRIMLGISAIANLITNSLSTVANPATAKLHHNEPHHK